MAKFKRILGWLLLIAGLIIIFGSLYFSYTFFTLKAEAPELFKATEEKNKTTISGSSGDLQEDMKKMVEEQVKNMVPAEFTSKFLNLISWSIFASLLVFAGSRIAGIGIRLTRKDL